VQHSAAEWTVYQTCTDAHSIASGSSGQGHFEPRSVLSALRRRSSFRHSGLHDRSSRYSRQTHHR